MKKKSSMPTDLSITLCQRFFWTKQLDFLSCLDLFFFSFFRTNTKNTIECGRHNKNSLSFNFFVDRNNTEKMCAWIRIVSIIQSDQTEWTKIWGFHFNSKKLLFRTRIVYWKIDFRFSTVLEHSLRNCFQYRISLTCHWNRFITPRLKWNFESQLKWNIFIRLLHNRVEMFLFLAPSRILMQIKQKLKLNESKVATIQWTFHRWEIMAYKHRQRVHRNHIFCAVWNILNFQIYT